MVPLPHSLKDVIRLADWLELYALSSADRNSSDGDLERVLNRSSAFEAEDRERLDETIGQVFSELGLRAAAAEPAYPFLVEGSVLQARTNWRTRSSYLFCLCLSYFGDKRTKGQAIYPRRMFESLCSDVASKLIQGTGVRFGSPRTPTEIPASFIQAVDELCQKRIGEGHGFQRGQMVHWSKDYGLDVVAWRHLLDGLPGKLLLFGACASGGDWEDKLNDLQPANFCMEYMTQVPVSPIIKTFFIPHRIDQRLWLHRSRPAGIILDRCRISALVPRLPAATHHGDPLHWTRAMLAGLSQ